MSKIAYNLLILLFLVSCNKGGGGVSVGEGKVSSLSIQLISPNTTPSLNSTPTVRVLGITNASIVQIHTSPSCTSLVGEGAVLNSESIITLNQLPVGEVSLYVKAAGNCSEELFVYQYGYKISGTLTYDFIPVDSGKADYEKTVKKPIRNILIKLVRVSNDEVLDEVSTSEEGKYSFYLTAVESVYFQVWAEMVSPSIIIEDNTNGDTTYVGETPSYLVDKNHIVDIHAQSGWSGTNSAGSYSSERVSAPFAILDSAYTAVQKIKNVRPNANFPPLKINWSINNVATTGNKSIGQIGTSHFSRADNELYILGKADSDTDENDRHVIVHEWGHYFDNVISRSDSTGGAHSAGDIKDMTLAFGEGWGNALSAMVFDPDIRYVDTGGNRQQATLISFSLESRSDPKKGWFSETSVQEILFDLYDSQNESGDNLSLGIGPLYDVMVGHQKSTSAQTSIFTFINGLKSNLPAYSSSIDLLTTTKDISPVVDDYGSQETNFDGWPFMTSVYEDVTVGGGWNTIRLWGSGLIHNDMRNSRYLKFIATSTSTKMWYLGSDSFLIHVFKSGQFIVNAINDEVFHNRVDDSAPTVYQHTFTTVPGQEYIIRVFTDDSIIYKPGFYLDVDIQLESL
jgi:hypothetical protein